MTLMCGDRWLETGNPFVGDDMSEASIEVRYFLMFGLVSCQNLSMTTRFFGEAKELLLQSL